MAGETKREKGKPTHPTWEWKSFPTEIYQKELACGIHFSIKGINTNAKPAFGVRIGSNSARKLPYVSLIRAIADGERFPLDYTVNRGSVATVFKQVTNIAGWEKNALPHPNVPRTEKKAILDAVRVVSASDCEVTDDLSAPISSRARQLLFPDGDGSYVSLIPLPAPVFAGHVRERWFSYRNSLPAPNDDSQRSPWINRAFMGFGGTNPQNAGRFMYHMKEPFIFPGPTEDPDIRRAYAIHYRGASLRLPYGKMQSYRDWRQQKIAPDGQKIAPDGQMPSNLRIRQTQAAFASEVTRLLLSRGKEAHALLQRHQQQLPTLEEKDGLVAPDTDPVANGLADPAHRDRQWPGHFAETVAHNIGNFQFADNRTMGLGAPEIRQLAGWIEDEVRRHGV